MAPLWTIFTLIPLILIVILWVAALMQIAKSNHLEPTERAVWVLIVVIAPFVGSIAWFAIGSIPRTRV